MKRGEVILQVKKMKNSIAVFSIYFAFQESLDN